MTTRKRALVTGLRGFTGRYVAAELQANGYDVFGLGQGPGEDERYYQADLADTAGLKTILAEVRPHVVLHLAALAFVGHGVADDFYQVNLIGTRHLLEAIHSQGGKPSHVLLASSANVYGNSSAGLLDEDTKPNPANDYAVSKLAMEHMASLWRDRLPIVIARPFNYTGVGQAGMFLLPKIVEHFRRKAPLIELGNLDVSRDFSDVRTVAYLYRRLIETPEAVGGVYNISSGRTYSLADVIALCSEITGHHMDVEVNPAFVRDNEVKVLQGDNRRLHALLGEWNSPGLRQTLQWMLSAD
ncbi:GDP-mannose 4,6-dehydratase [Pseudoxanthomonas japonensis]|nr:GDP-mannose 4,6-dehydratase [Pseudoxanthomonas japonensis]